MLGAKLVRQVGSRRLLHLYLRRKMTSREIAGLCGVDKKTVISALSQCGAELRVGAPPPKSKFSTEAMVKFYEDGLSVEAVAERVGISYSSVLGRFRRAKYSLRSAVSTRMCFSSQLKFLSEVDKAYIAGMVDGEGTIALTQDKRAFVHPRVSIANSHEGVLQFIQRICGIGRVFLSSGRKRNPNHKPGYKWETTKTVEVLAFLSSVLPYLRIKAARGKAVIRFCERRLKRIKKGSPGFIFSDYRDFSIVKKMNKRGLA